MYGRCQRIFRWQFIRCLVVENDKASFWSIKPKHKLMRSILILALVLSVSVGFAQTARDYFFPARDKNLSIYSSKFGNDNEQKETRVYVKDYGDSALITTQSNLVVRVNSSKQPDAWEQVVMVSPLEIVALRGKAETNNAIETFDNKGEILFKVPAKKGEVAEWSSSIQKGAIKTIYKSEFATVKVNGKKRKAIKVSCVQKRNHSGEESVFYIDYFVEGIGRYKRTAVNGLELEVLAKQTYDPNVPRVN